ncbi:hypothetical protein DA83_12150 [Pseudomonas sp. 250J]|nr:hypothetical protein DA83_12150 [Pseudomonas sp. 250J]
MLIVPGFKFVLQRRECRKFFFMIQNDFGMNLSIVFTIAEYAPCCPQFDRGMEVFIRLGVKV